MQTVISVPIYNNCKFGVLTIIHLLILCAFWSISLAMGGYNAKKWERHHLIHTKKIYACLIQFLTYAEKQ